jgi:MraZ protein
VDRFLSHFVNRFDAKGRISVPASFRAALGKEGFEGVFAHPALDSPALDCGGARLLSSIHAMLDAMPPYSRDREDLSLALLGTGEILTLDSEGRMRLGERMREAIGVSDEAVFVGQGNKFQIWEPRRFDAHLEEAKSRARALRMNMGAQYSREPRE